MGSDPCCSAPGRREDFREALDTLTRTMIAYHGRSLATISSMVTDLNGEKAAAGSARPKKAGLFPQDMSACVEDILKGRLFAEIPPPSLKMGKVRVTVGTGAGNYPVQAPHHTWTSDQ